MSGRRTAVLAAIFSALAIYFALFEGFTLRAAIPEWERQEKILKCDTGGLRAIELSTPRGQVAGERTADGWKPQQPVEVPQRASQAFEDLAESLCRLPIVDRIEQPSSLADFGLEPPSAQIRVVNGAKTEVLLLGSATPASNLMYAKMAERPDVMKIGVLLRSDVEKVLNSAKTVAPSPSAEEKQGA